ncbi:MAG: hypothetical protein LCH38_00190 [Proteobacteria bacterium]|nr:hypothetical protein [Pseudomonadota bacterium]
MRSAALVLFLVTSPAMASGGAEPRPPEGRYALHGQACKANDIFLTLKGDRMDLPVFSCQGLGFKVIETRGDGALWAVKGKRCQGEEAPPGPQDFKLEARGTSLRILWADGSRSAPLMRCGR